VDKDITLRVFEPSGGDKMSVMDYTITGLEKAREQLVGMPKADLTHQAITNWYETRANYNAIQAAEAGSMLLRRILHAVNGLNDAPANVLDDARKNIVDHLDAAISKLDATRPVRSILEDRILHVKDTKLSRLLSEFNIHRERAPNLCAISYRTILSLIISERAKLAAPGSGLATKQDLNWEPDIKEAIRAKIFDDSNTRRLQNYLTRLTKDTMDIVAHKTGNNSIVSKDDLSAAVDLLNNLLAEIV
jgi:hypothetical protein